MRAELRGLYSAGADPLPEYAPRGPFGIAIRAIVGPHNGPGEESFDFTLCTPEWFADAMHSDFALGRHYLFTTAFDYRKLENYVRGYCVHCTGETWQEVAEKLSRLGHWEFEDYKA